MSSDNLNSANRGLITNFPWKMLSDWPLSGTGSLVPALVGYGQLVEIGRASCRERVCYAV